MTATASTRSANEALPPVPWKRYTTPRGRSGTYEITGKPSNVECRNSTEGVTAQPVRSSAASRAATPVRTVRGAVAAQATGC